jgi:hypothetical protein
MCKATLEISRFLPRSAYIALNPSSIHAVCVFFLPRLTRLKVAGSGMFTYGTAKKKTDRLKNVFRPCHVGEVKMTHSVTKITDAANFKRIRLFLSRSQWLCLALMFESGKGFECGLLSGQTK